jgi:hypothetical protein
LQEGIAGAVAMRFHKVLNPNKKIIISLHLGTVKKNIFPFRDHATIKWAYTVLSAIYPAIGMACPRAMCRAIADDLRNAACPGGNVPRGQALNCLHQWG